MCLSVLYSTDSAAVSHDEKQFFARSVGLSSRRNYLDDTLFILTFVSNVDTRKVNEFKLTMYTENIQDD